MRLSEAIALGRALITPMAGEVFNADESAGCALGMAGKAIGGYGHNSTFMEHEAKIVWPWLNLEVTRICECEHWKMPSSYLQAVVHLFDAHVMQDKSSSSSECSPWTLDQLIDWVRSVEPAEETLSSAEAVCHRTTESSGSCASSRDAELPELAKEAGECSGQGQRARSVS